MIIAVTCGGGFFLAGCGPSGPTATGQAGGSITPESLTIAPAASTSTILSATESSTTLPIDTTPLNVPMESHPIETLPPPLDNLNVTVGPISLLLPKDTTIDPRHHPGVESWLVPGKAVIIVGTQTEEPRMPSSQFAGTMEMNGIKWDKYNYNPMDGGEVGAVAKVGDEWVFVTVNAWSSEYIYDENDIIDPMLYTLLDEVRQVS